MFQPSRIMMQLMLLVFVRTSELIETPWSKIDLDNETWVILGKREDGPQDGRPEEAGSSCAPAAPRVGYCSGELHTLTG